MFLEDSGGFRPSFTVQYFDADGKRRKAPPGTPDKATAERIAAKIENEVAERRRGLIDTKAERIDGLTGAAVMRAIGERRSGGASLRTCNSYLTAVRSFTRWLWKEKRTPDDNLAGLSQFNEATDRQHIRRELTP